MKIKTTELVGTESQIENLQRLMNIHKCAELPVLNTFEMDTESSEAYIKDYGIHFDEDSYQSYLEVCELAYLLDNYKRDILQAFVRHLYKGINIDHFSYTIVNEFLESLKK